MKVLCNGKELKVFEMGRYYAYSDDYATKNYKNILCWDIFKQFNEKSFARFDYFKSTKTLNILLFRKDTSKKFLKYLLNELSKEIEIKEIIFEDKYFNTLREVLQ